MDHIIILDGNVETFDRIETIVNGMDDDTTDNVDSIMYDHDYEKIMIHLGDDYTWAVVAHHLHELGYEIFDKNGDLI